MKSAKLVISVLALVLSLESARAEYSSGGAFLHQTAPFLPSNDNVSRARAANTETAAISDKEHFNHHARVAGMSDEELDATLLKAETALIEQITKIAGVKGLPENEITALIAQLVSDLQTVSGDAADSNVFENSRKFMDAFETKVMGNVTYLIPGARQQQEESRRLLNKGLREYLHLINERPIWNRLVGNLTQGLKVQPKGLDSKGPSGGLKSAIFYAKFKGESADTLIIQLNKGKDSSITMNKLDREMRLLQIPYILREKKLRDFGQHEGIIRNVLAGKADPDTINQMLGLIRNKDTNLIVTQFQSNLYGSFTDKEIGEISKFVALNELPSEVPTQDIVQLLKTSATDENGKTNLALDMKRLFSGTSPETVQAFADVARKFGNTAVADMASSSIVKDENGKTTLKFPEVSEEAAAAAEESRLAAAEPASNQDILKSLSDLYNKWLEGKPATDSTTTPTSTNDVTASGETTAEDTAPEEPSALEDYIESHGNTEDSEAGKSPNALGISGAAKNMGSLVAGSGGNTVPPPPETTAPINSTSQPAPGQPFVVDNQSFTPVGQPILNGDTPDPTDFVHYYGLPGQPGMGYRVLKDGSFRPYRGNTLLDPGLRWRQTPTGWTLSAANPATPATSAITVARPGATPGSSSDLSQLEPMNQNYVGLDFYSLPGQNGTRGYVFENGIKKPFERREGGGILIRISGQEWQQQANGTWALIPIR